MRLIDLWDNAHDEGYLERRRYYFGGYIIGLGEQPGLERHRRERRRH